MKKIILILLSIGFLFSCGKKETPKPEAKYDCENVDDCISKYDFVAARAYMAADESLGAYSHLQKITEAESIYLAKNGEFDAALNVINEASHTNYYDHEKEKAKYVVIEMAVNNFLEKEDYKSAKKWALKASDLRNVEGWNESDTRDWKKEETQQKLLLKKIADYEKIVK
jgi:hypothetical protein